MSFIVHSAGAQSLIVDEGRPRHRALGVPVGGAADRLSFALGNALVGNEPGAAALEVALAGPTLEATAEHALVVFGAPFAVLVNDRPREPGRTFTVRAGDIITISTTPMRLRAYVCVPGGFESKTVLGSRSALAPLRNGDRLECAAGTLRTRWLLSSTIPVEDPGLLRVLPGSHLGQFAAPEVFAAPFTVKPESNRMGLRLAGPPFRQQAEELLSAPVCPGTVQVTNDGLPVVLGVDAQTIGGYRRLAHVIAADGDKLAQLRSGDAVRFVLVDLPAAAEFARQRRAWLGEWVTRLRTSA